MKMTYTIKPLEWEKPSGEPEYLVCEAAGVCHQYRIVMQGGGHIIGVRVLSQEITFTFLDYVQTEDAAISAANEHHRKQIEKFLLPVE